MGTRVAPSYANIFMGYFEERFVYKNRKTVDLVQIHRRHLRSLDQVRGGTKVLHSGPQPSPQDYQVHSGNFQDRHQLPGCHGQHFGRRNHYRPIHQTDKHQYLLRNSAHPKHCKLGIPYGQFLRIRRICSSTIRYREKASEFRHHFQKRGFEETLLDAAITRAQERSRKDTLQKKTLTTYVKKANNFKSHRTGKCYAIRTHINCQSKNIVYLIQCKKCSVQYVGETKQTLANRLNGHRSAINTKKDTPVSAHFNQTHHSVGDREILGIERLRYTGNEDLTRQRRLQRESYWIHQLRTSHPDGLSQESLEITRMVKAAESGARRINIVCEDTYVFVLLLHYFAQRNLTCRLTMEGPSAERTTIDIGATAKAFEENVKRAHIQTAIWKYATSYEPPGLDPVQFGWERDERSRCLVAVTVQPDVTVAPPEVLEMVRCGCATEAPCSTSMCGCYTAHLSCTIFCGCHGQVHCHNHHTRRVDGLFDD
ncbi:corticospinal neuron axon guidance through spinal cord [Branchiostoma belcheri]|nr:corticospinal neuron axon guidance through spinal cord [Branchiostoma belcheri]